jgi:hypothetical protein
LANPIEQRQRVIGESGRASVISATVLQPRHFGQRYCFLVTRVNLARNGQGFAQIPGR